VIIGAILAVFKAVIRLLLAPLWLLIPAPPSWVTDHLDEAAQVWSIIGSFETWIPVSLTFTIATAVVATIIIGWAVGLVRVIVSYFTFGGGAT
jgi:hypothetical protein